MLNFRLFGITLFIHLSSFSLFSIFAIQQHRSYCQFFVFFLQQFNNLLCIVNFQISPCGNTHPGHSTKFVTLPSSILLYWFYRFGISYCNSQLMWLVLLSVVWSQVRQFFLWECLCTINHDEITWVNLVVYWFILLMFTSM